MPPPSRRRTRWQPGDIIRVDGATNLTIRGFTIAGPLPNALFCSTESRTGLFVANNGSVTVDDNRFEEIRAADPNLRGCQNGIAIRVGRQATPTFGTATITNNEFAKYQKGAIVVDGSGSNATIGLNQVTGEGPVSYIAQNGIQVSRGATANMAGNTVSGHTYSQAPSSSSTGVLIFQGGSGIVVNNNNVHHNDDNIDLITTNGAVVQQNLAQNATFFDGLFADSDTSGNQFTGNVSTQNQLLDCEDLSTAVAVPPVANTWTGNTGTTQTPPGICTPPVGNQQQQQSRAQARASGHSVLPVG
ncbi:MAG TPA: right-handed parallel beta-helix repeat-containing protein [Acidimicrobiia bacterium]|nr:right-handed parallel beta-helix repeat-containing protein [Acidimicrobiia bacterium]